MSGQNHHYLPRGILKKFGVGKKNQQIFFVDKNGSSNSKKTNLKNIACINNFYKFEQSSRSLEDDFFKVIDDKAPKAITKLLSNINEPMLSDEDRSNLISYVASQITRVPFQANIINNFNSAYKEQISDEVNLFDEGTKSRFLLSIEENTNQYREILSRLSMTVLRTFDEFELVIGDNPVMIFESNNELVSKRDNIFATNGKIFMMPLSPHDMLIYFDPSLKSKLFEYAQISNLWQFANASQYVFGRSSALLEDTLKENYKYSYDYIHNVRSDLLLDIKRGERIFIGPVQYRFEGQVLNTLKKQANRKTNKSV